MKKETVTTVNYITSTDLEEITSGFVTVEYYNAWCGLPAFWKGLGMHSK